MGRRAGWAMSAIAGGNTGSPNLGQRLSSPAWDDPSMADAAAPAAVTAQRSSGLSLLLLAALALVWGANWPAMKVVLGELPILVFRALCLVLAGPSLLAISRASGAEL